MEEGRSREEELRRPRRTVFNGPKRVPYVSDDRADALIVILEVGQVSRGPRGPQTTSLFRDSVEQKVFHRGERGGGHWQHR